MTDETSEKQPEEAPMPPPGFSLIPTESITRLQEVSAQFKGKPVIREIAEGEPEVASALEQLGQAVTGVITGPPSAKPEGADEKRALQSPEEQQQGVLAIGALLGVGAVLMWALNKKKQEEAEAAMAQQQAMMRAAAEAQQQQPQQYQQGG